MGKFSSVTFRDPRFDPVIGDVVEVDLGDGDSEKRKVVGKALRSGEFVVQFTVEGDTAVHFMRVKHWREYADDAAVLNRGRSE